MNTKLQPVDIIFKDLTYKVRVHNEKGKKTVLKSISGKFKSGELTAIMGPSGAGKSSLLNILTGFVKEGVEGEINIGHCTKTNKKICSYILQDDNLFPWFTVEEVMLLAATLKISKESMCLREKRILVDDILNNLGLSHTKLTKCSNLSGGQKKRLSIALELIDNPPVLFLDEPTTGLDSSTSVDCINLLNKLSRQGRTIVCTIHQPSALIFQAFGHVYVLAEGYCVFQGPPKYTVPFLSSVGLQCPQYHNPADFLLEVANCEYGSYTKILSENAKDNRWIDDENLTVETVELTKKLPSYDMLDPNKKISPPPEWIQLWALIGRCHVQFYRDWTVTHLKLGLHILCAILIGIIYGDSGINATKAFSNVGLLMIGVVYLWYTSIMPGILKFPLEIATIKKETFNNWYRLRTYYLATLITSTPVHVIFSTTFSTILYVMTGQPLELNRYVKFAFTYITQTIVADGFGLLVGTLAKPVNGTFCGAILSCIMLLFGGFLIFYDHMPFLLNLVTYLSPMRYAWEALVLSMYGEGRSDMICPDNVMYCHFRKAQLLLQTLGMTKSSYNVDIIMLIICICIFKTLAYFGLRRALKSG